jgi:hypothetical protein
MAITESRSLPPQFVEDLGRDYSTQLTGLTSQPLDTTKFQPMVAGQDAAQTSAYNLATQQGKGIGAFQPYLTQAGAYQTGTGSFAGQPTNMMGAQDYLNAAQNQSGIAQTQIGSALAQSQAAGNQLGTARSQIGNAQTQSTAQGALSGPTAYQQFMSPYQQDVIDASMSEFDRQSAKGMTGIGQLAAKSGNLGGGREGVMRSEYQSDSDMKRAQLQAQLLNQGFNQAQGQANTAFGQQGQLMAGANTLGADQQRMASLVPGLYGQDISTLGSAGANQQAQEQAILDQQREANRLAAYEPYERLGYMGAGMGNVMGGAMGQYQSQVTPNQSPLQQALGIASLGYGAYKGLGGKGFG